MPGHVHMCSGRSLWQRPVISLRREGLHIPGLWVFQVSRLMTVMYVSNDDDEGVY